MPAKLIAKLQEPVVNGNFIICKTEEKGVYITKNEYLDANGNIEATSVGWSRVGEPELRHLLSLHFELPAHEIGEILAR